MIDLRSAGILTSLEARMFEHARNHANLFNAEVVGLDVVRARARRFADDLAGRSGAADALNVAMGLQMHLISPWERNTLGFWSTDLGQAIAWWDGASVVSAQAGPVDRRLVVQGAAGVSRQASYKIVAGMKRHGDGNPTADAVACYLQNKYPHVLLAEVTDGPA
jgi:hypothetical protein